MHDTLAKSILAFEAGLEVCNQPEDRVLVRKYMAALGPVLAKVAIGQDVIADLTSIERLFGNSWIVDDKPFQNAFKLWRQFKDEYERFALGAMTVNERLSAMGLLQEFDAATASGDAEKMRQILMRIYVDSESIEKITGNEG